MLRPGRFDRQIVVDRPDLRGREAILRVHARSVALAGDVDLHVIAARTVCFAGAELANVINEAALLPARRGKAAVGMAELKQREEISGAKLRERTGAWRVRGGPDGERALGQPQVEQAACVSLATTR